MTAARAALAIAVLALLPAPGTVAAQPAAAADGAHRGYLAARLTGGGQLQVLEELHADRFFVPASVLKLATVAAALEHLGAGYRWTTRLTARGAIDGEVLAADLVVEPGADPTWGPQGAGDAGLAALAGQVRTRGITRIAGDIVIDTSRFPGRRHPLDREYGDLPYAHGTPAAALAVDEGTITAHVAPGAAVGRPARVRVADGIKVINQTVTVGQERHGSGTLDLVPVWGTDMLLLRGEYPISEPAATVAASDPRAGPPRGPAPAARARRGGRGAGRAGAAGTAAGGAWRANAAGGAPLAAAGGAAGADPHEQPQLVRRHAGPGAGRRGGRQRPLR